MRPFTRSTVTEPGRLEAELARLRPGDLVMEHGQFRDEVCCAGLAVPGADLGTWWAVGASARGLRLPDALLAGLRTAAADLSGAPLR
jgi:DNA-binding IclR family transcriptional regulator